METCKKPGIVWDFTWFVWFTKYNLAFEFRWILSFSSLVTTIFTFYIWETKTGVHQTVFINVFKCPIEILVWEVIDHWTIEVFPNLCCQNHSSKFLKLSFPSWCNILKMISSFMIYKIKCELHFSIIWPLYGVATRQRPEI